MTRTHRVRRQTCLTRLVLLRDVCRHGLVTRRAIMARLAMVVTLYYHVGRYNIRYHATATRQCCGSHARHMSGPVYRLRHVTPCLQNTTRHGYVRRMSYHHGITRRIVAGYWHCHRYGRLLAALATMSPTGCWLGLWFAENDGHYVVAILRDENADALISLLTWLNIISRR